MKDFDLENLDRKNIYTLPENLFENIQQKVLSEVKDFDLEKLERKNIYRVPEHLFETVQNNVLEEIKYHKKAPVFNLKWGYAAAASLALIFGSTFVYNSNSDTADPSQNDYAQNITVPKTESQIAYETLASDLTSVEKSNQKSVNQSDIKATARQVSVKYPAKNQNNTVKKSTEVRMNEYLDSFTTSEIAELANNSSQDVYLDLYN